jgi:hypothetical protein
MEDVKPQRPKTRGLAVIGILYSLAGGKGYRGGDLYGLKGSHTGRLPWRVCSRSNEITHGMHGQYSRVLMLSLWV